MKIPLFPPENWKISAPRKIPKFCSEIFAFSLCMSRKKESIRFYVLSNPYRSVIAKRVIHLESPLFFKLKTKTFQRRENWSYDMLLQCFTKCFSFLCDFSLLKLKRIFTGFAKDWKFETIIWTHSELSSRLRAAFWSSKRNQRSVKSIRSDWLQLTFRNNTLEASFNIYNSNFMYCWMRKTVKWSPRTLKVSQESSPLVFKLSRHKN